MSLWWINQAVGNSRPVGASGLGLTDVRGKRIFPESVEVDKAAAKGAGELRYTWLNPG
jgi:hypothetical protein